MFVAVLLTFGGIVARASRFRTAREGRASESFNDACPIKRTGPIEATLTSTNSAGRKGTFYLPSDYASAPRPLLVALHGTGGSGQGMVNLFRDSAERRQFIVVAPDSRIAPNGQPSWEVPSHPGETTEDRAHIQHCVDEVLALSGVRVDTSSTLIVGHSGGGSTAPYEASVESLYSAFAVLHGGAFVGGLGARRPRGWFSTGSGDGIRPPAMVRGAAEQIRRAGFDDVTYRDVPGGHEVGNEEVSAVVGWWLGPQMPRPRPTDVRDGG
ncbi:MAG: alpha/beta hydrolase [Polyangiaceae bacterium]